MTNNPYQLSMDSPETEISEPDSLGQNGLTGNIVPGWSTTSINRIAVFEDLPSIYTTIIKMH